MKSIIRETWLFLSIGTLAAAALAVAAAAVPQIRLHEALNGCRSAAADTFFRFYTDLAPYGIWILAGAFFLARKKRLAAFAAVSELCSGAAVQILKFAFDAPRPGDLMAAGAMPDLPLAAGVALHTGRSFPSGHAASFAVLFLVACLAVAALAESRAARYALQVLFSVLFLAGCYSRIYLSQHFAADVAAGALAGTAATLAAAQFFRGKSGASAPGGDGTRPGGGDGGTADGRRTA